MDKNRGLVLGVVAVLVVGAGSASFLDSFGSISGTADVEPALEVEEVYYNSNVSGQDSGEYILLEANTDLDFDNWRIEDAGGHVDSSSGEVDEGLFALVDDVDDSTDEAEFDVPKGEDVDIVNAGNLADGGLSPSEDLEVIYEPSSTVVESITYDSPGCEKDESYDVSADSSEELCKSALLDVVEVKNDDS